MAVEGIGSGPVSRPEPPPPPPPPPPAAEAARPAAAPATPGDGFQAAGGPAAAPRNQGDTFQGPELRAAPPQAELRNHRPAPDTAFDGFIVTPNGVVNPRDTNGDNLPAFQPQGPQVPMEGRDPNPRPAVFVNGINNTAMDNARSAQNLANALGQPVIGVHNATVNAAVDVGQAALQKAGLTTAPDRTLAGYLTRELAAGRGVDVHLHSQGALVGSSAIQMTRDNLIRQHGLSPAEADRRLGMLNVRSYGGASTNWPQGPNYRHYINLADPVPRLFGRDMWAPDARWQFSLSNLHSFDGYLDRTYGNGWRR
jgi:hypothetical protein